MEITTLLALNKQGLTSSQIADKVGICRRTVSALLAREGVTGNNYNYVNQLSETQIAILYGTVLGDACLKLRGKSVNAQLSMEHCHKQKDYLQWKVDSLAGFFTNTTLRVTSRSVAKDSKSHPILTTVRSQLYPNNKKTMTPANLSLLDGLSERSQLLAVWFMDDGTFSGRSLIMCLGGLDNDQYLLTSDWFTALGFENRLQPDKLKKAAKLCFNRQTSIRFAEFIRPKMHESMLYKLDKV